MKVKATISPVVQLGNEMNLPCSYQINGTWRILTDNDTMEIVQGDLKNAKSQKRNDILFNQKLNRDVTFEYEDNPELQSELDKGKQKVVEVFFAQHPALLYNGKHHKNTQNPLFDMVNQNEKKAAAVISFKDKLAIQNRIVSMDLEELRNVAYFYSKSPAGLSENDLQILLGDPSTGICMIGENAESFKNTWMEISEETERIVVLKKAISSGIIEERKKDGRSDYYLNQEFVGVTFNDVLAYSKREPKIYENHIKRVVNEKEEDTSKEKVATHNEKKVAEKVDAGEEKVKSWTLAELTEMREKLYKLKDEGYVQKSVPIHNLLGATLEKKLKEAEAKKAEAEAKLVDA